jgi:protein TonB
MKAVLPDPMLQDIGGSQVIPSFSRGDSETSQGMMLRLAEPPPPMPPNPSWSRTTGELGLNGRTRWLPSLAASILFHAATAGLVMINWSDGEHNDAAPPAAMVVELAILPASPPDQPSEVPPGPEQVEAAPEPRPLDQAKFDPPPQVDPSLKPEFALPAKPQIQRSEEMPNVAETARQTTAPPTVEAPRHDKSAAPVEGRNAAPPSNAEQAWEGRLLARLERNKRYPAAAQGAGQQDTVFLRLIIDRKGRLIDATLVKSGGFALLDGETLALARRASPYPAPPDSVEGTRIVRVVPVEFYIKKRR